MPKPTKGETERDFLQRCIPDLIKKEDYPQKQSIAICYSIYRKEGTEEKSPKPEKKSNRKWNKINLYCYMCDY